MALNIAMQKSVDSLNLALKKLNISEINPCQVKLAMDVSGSFVYEHENGYTQLLLNRFVPFSLVFDKDKTLDVCAFSHTADVLTDLNEYNYENYITENVMTSNSYHGGTEYTPPLKALLEKKRGFFSKLFGGSTPKQEKTLLFFITDGEASDQTKAFNYIKENINENTFIVFLSIGNSEYPFFSSNYKDGKHTHYFNITNNQLQNIKDYSDEEVYNMIISDNLAKWFGVK